MGWSNGRWEGDTLVVDVTGFTDHTWFDRAGNFHSDALHVVERYTPVSPYHIQYEATIEDPKVFTRPWKMSFPALSPCGAERSTRRVQLRAVRRRNDVHAAGSSAAGDLAGEVEQARRDLKRAKSVARELEIISEQIRKSLTTHHSSIARFKDRVTELGSQQQEVAWQELCKEAEEMLKPTLRLAAQIAHAYDEIRQQTNHLMTFTELRTDPLTRVSNRRALDECLENMFSLLHRYEQVFSISIFDIDHFKQVNDEQGHVQGDHILQRVARIIDDNVRDTDVVARYGGEEFVVVMPHTPLDGANIFSERLRAKIEAQIDLTVSGGVAQAVDGDTPQSLIARSDAASIARKAAGRNRVYQHTGCDIEPIVPEIELAAVSASNPPIDKSRSLA